MILVIRDNNDQTIEGIFEQAAKDCSVYVLSAKDSIRKRASAAMCARRSNYIRLRG